MRCCNWCRDLSKYVSAPDFVSALANIMEAEEFWKQSSLRGMGPLEIKLACLACYPIVLERANVAGTSFPKSLFLDFSAAYLAAGGFVEKAVFFAIPQANSKPEWFGVSVSDDALTVDFWNLAPDPGEFKNAFKTSFEWIYFA